MADYIVFAKNTSVHFERNKVKFTRGSKTKRGLLYVTLDYVLAFKNYAFNILYTE